MVQRVLLVITDDIDGSEPAETVHFGLDGKAYEIDLSPSHAASLRRSLAPLIAAARVALAPRLPEPRRGIGGDTPVPAEIRRWAAEHGIPVASRGRLPDDLRFRYEDAHIGS